MKTIHKTVKFKKHNQDEKVIIVPTHICKCNLASKKCDNILCPNLKVECF